MNIPHTNVDLVFKESLVLFKDKTLDFLGITNIAPITESLRTETVEIEVTWEFQDLAFATQDGRGIHFEEETNLSKDDLLRFLGYNTSLSRVHNREFVTVIFVRDSATLTEIRTEQVHFAPIIIQCFDIDANAMLEGLRKDITSGKQINELSLIYLPLFHSSNHTPTDLFIESTRLIKAMRVSDDQRMKIFSLLLTLSGKVVDQSKLDEIAREVSTMGNVVIEYFEERGKERGKEEERIEIVKKMLADNCDSLDIIRYTGISAERLREMRNTVSSEAV